MNVRAALFLTFIVSSFICNYDISTNGVKVSNRFPIIDRNGKLLGYDTSSVLIYCQDDNMAYKLSYHYDSTSKNELLLSEIRYHYFVYTKNRIFGYDFDRFKSDKPIRKTIDSVFKNEWIVQNRIFPIFSDNIVMLLSSDSTRNSLNEKFRIVDKNDSRKKATAYLYYSNDFENIEYSMSRELDSIKSMKLVSIRVVYDSRKINDSLQIDAFETYTGMERLKHSEVEEMKKYIEKLSK